MRFPYQINTQSLNEQASCVGSKIAFIVLPSLIGIVLQSNKENLYLDSQLLYLSELYRRLKE